MLPRFQALQITQEQPPYLLDDLSCQFVMLQSIGFIDADLINHLAPRY
jgi:hypothetical protein